MSARHARVDDPALPTLAGLRLVDDAPPDPASLPPEVTAVVDAAALLHGAVLRWAASTAGPVAAPPRHGPAPSTGRHRAPSLSD